MEDTVSKEEIEDLKLTLKDIGLSMRRFCLAAAGEEYSLTEEEIKTKAEAYRKRLGRESMSRFEFNLMLEILAKQEEYIKSNRIYVTRKKDLFSNRSFEKSLLSSFKASK